MRRIHRNRNAYRLHSYSIRIENRSQRRMLRECGSDRLGQAMCEGNALCLGKQRRHIESAANLDLRNFGQRLLHLGDERDSRRGKRQSTRHLVATPFAEVDVAARTSSSVILPPGPVPFSEAKSTFNSRAIRRAAGDALMPPAS